MGPQPSRAGTMAHHSPDAVAKRPAFDEAVGPP